MGFDISYHPISEKEIQDWYFDTLATPARIQDFALEFKIDDFIAFLEIVLNEYISTSPPAVSKAFVVKVVKDLISTRPSAVSKAFVVKVLNEPILT